LREDLIGYKIFCSHYFLEFLENIVPLLAEIKKV
jgi:hypothetical protein